MVDDACMLYEARVADDSVPLYPRNCENRHSHNSNVFTKTHGGKSFRKKNEDLCVKGVGSSSAGEFLSHSMGVPVFGHHSISGLRRRADV